MRREGLRLVVATSAGKEELDGLLGEGQGVVAAAQLGQRDAEVVQRRGEVRQVAGVVRGEGAEDLDSLLVGGQGVVAAAQPGQPAPEVGNAEARSGR